MTEQPDNNEDQIAEMLDEARGLVEHFAGLIANFHVSVLHGVEITLPDVNELFRVLHTLKGVSHIAGLPHMLELLHKVEDFIDAVRNGKSALNQDEVETLGDVQHVCEMAFTSYPTPPSEEHITECHRLGGFFQQKGKSEAAESPGAESKGEIEKPTEFELAAYMRVCGRNSDNLFAAIFPPTKFSDTSAMLADDSVQNAGRLGEPILGRQHETGFLFLFGSDSNWKWLACSDTQVVSLEKSPQPLHALGSPWSFLQFGNSSPSEEKSAVSTQPEMNGTSQLAATTSPAEQPQNAAATTEPEEDFDTDNLAPGKVAATMELEPEMLQDFLVNADELLEQLGQSMLQLESEPGNSEAIESIFRAAHTIKGTAGMFGFRAVEKLTHKMENLFDHIRKGERKVTPEMVDALLFALDQVRGMFQNCKAGKSPELPINAALEKLSGKATTQQPVPAKAGNAAVVSAPPASATASTNTQNVTSSVTVTPVKAETHAPPAAAAEGGDAAAKTPSNQGGTIRVDLNRLDTLVNLVGELVIDRTRFAEIEDELRRALGNGDLGSRMSESVLLFTRHMNEVQNVIMKIRMVPIGNAFFRFNRVVRDLARQLEKEIELEIKGGDTELDKTLVEDIGDPLVHLIRNSVDHGIEMPADRVAAGKSRSGKLTVSASQDGNMIVISVADNGKGLQVERIRQKAIERGLLKESDIVTNKDIFNLIFEAGFSTAEKVTNISGRGVGMDVVKKSILKLKGIIDIDSEVGKGTCVTIKLPLTLAIIPSLMVSAEGETFAIPLVNVIESIRIASEEVQTVASRSYVKLRDGVLPLMSLANSFGLDGLGEKRWYKNDDLEPGSRRGRGEEGAANANTTLPATARGRGARQRKQVFVVLGVGEQRVGVFVDALLGQQEIVIKPLGTMLGKVPGVAGGCVLGNGRVALVLDASEIIEDLPAGNLQVPHAS